MVSTIALLISVLYWTLLHPAVVDYGFLKVWLFFPWSDLGTFTFVMKPGFLNMWLFFTYHENFIYFSDPFGRVHELLYAWP